MNAIGFSTIPFFFLIFGVLIEINGRLFLVTIRAQIQIIQSPEGMRDFFPVFALLIPPD